MNPELQIFNFRDVLVGTYFVKKILIKMIIIEMNVKLRQVVWLSCDPTRLVLRSFKAII